ncbi:hypothetical protein ABZ154_09165 [Streptomyces sp. NPDC006261]|uniref:hypothetical protein n=1 Tax=Streptomyces sp. NPDC006261 TaxID=3156739 RepID=UPI0033A190B9
MTVEQSNGVATFIHPTVDGEIVFDSHVSTAPNRMVSGKSLYQNLTVDDARGLIEALTKSVEEITA